VISPWERPASHVSIRTEGPVARVLIDGHELRAVTKVVLSLDSDGPPSLKLSLMSAGGLEADVDAAIWVDKATARALKAMGWTPPVTDSSEPVAPGDGTG